MNRSANVRFVVASLSAAAVPLSLLLVWMFVDFAYGAHDPNSDAYIRSYPVVLPWLLVVHASVALAILAFTILLRKFWCLSRRVLFGSALVVAGLVAALVVRVAVVGADHTLAFIQTFLVLGVVGLASAWVWWKVSNA
jgi:hypothetical protein